ncbi:GDNF family receptor alpha-1 [Galemys pyrenaicus]|uniref:GDNF family receptor alpha-1 n=1 Tax=Galemys pyrenaicus TaxID=202257 RepID=A0A8J6DPQ6_GALPY|nr:GDNF family receptor alpha-1 [Galemys pyrenaicus]
MMLERAIRKLQSNDVVCLTLRGDAVEHIPKGNNCLDAAKACNLDDTCKKYRSAYITPCTTSMSNEVCNRRKCHKALRQFFDKVPAKHSYGMLFCSCRDIACTERRRQTIVPVCSYEEREKPNCLNLQDSCKTNYICRLALCARHRDGLWDTEKMNALRLDTWILAPLQFHPGKLSSRTASDGTLSTGWGAGVSCGLKTRTRAHIVLVHGSVTCVNSKGFRWTARTPRESPNSRHILHSHQCPQPPSTSSTHRPVTTSQTMRDPTHGQGHLSRLADFFTNCQPESRSASSCLKENYADCLLAYSGLIGTVMTPNYVDSSSLSVAPWCDCTNSGNDLEECSKFLNFFKDNTCLKNAIQAFGNGSDVTVWQPALPVQTTTAAATTTAFRVKNKPLGPAGSENEIPTHVLPPCANLQGAPGRWALTPSSSSERCMSLGSPWLKRPHVALQRDICRKTRMLGRVYAKARLGVPAVHFEDGACHAERGPAAVSQ